MKVYTYKPPKVKSSTKSSNVVNEKGEIVCSFKRTFKYKWNRIADLFLENNYFVQYDIYSVDGSLLYQGTKIPRWGKTQYKIIHTATKEEFHITYLSWQTVSPEMQIASTSTSQTFVVKKDVMERARIYYNDIEIARWDMKMMKLFQSTIQIEESSPIQDPAFFVCFFQCVFYLGN
ncbi:hypothetical protein [Bacillus sp. B1-b2]|uniref:tubby C-terminal domain-like protein n=1 Tax=Bacillus sp. B1-b2 TaxID=2653201 RepID=UPI001261F849|nr:hypothetical protein [Bacillus sp. B1-b2]KAB7672227.1 hypothetical protein F9279_04755 [Bacillus sp. B1-b2]